MDRGAWQATVWAVARELDTTEVTEHTCLYELCVCLVVQLCPTLCDPMDCSLPGSSVHGVLQARTPEWVAISSSRGFS